MIDEIDKLRKNMPPWKPGTTEFPMKVIPNGKAGTYHINVPPAIREKLGNPTHIKFVIRGSRILVEGASNQSTPAFVDNPLRYE